MIKIATFKLIRIAATVVIDGQQPFLIGEEKWLNLVGIPASAVA